jgi:hypothetical protein
MKSRQILNLILLVSLFALVSLVASCGRDGAEPTVPAETISPQPQGDADSPPAEETEHLSEVIMPETEIHTVFDDMFWFLRFLKKQSDFCFKSSFYKR